MELIKDTTAPRAPIIVEGKLEYKIQNRKIDLKFIWDVIKVVFKTYCVDTIVLTDKDAELGACVIMNADYVDNFDDIEKFKALLKSEGIDLRKKYVWNICLNDYDYSEVEIIYDPINIVDGKKRTNVITVNIVCDNIELKSLKKSFEEIDK